MPTDISVHDAVAASIAHMVPAWRSQIHAEVMNAAARQRAQHTDFWKGKPENIDYRDIRAGSPPTSLLSVPKSGNYADPPYAHHVRAAKAGGAEINHDVVARQADDLFRDMHDRFVHRAAAKLSAIAGKHGVSRVTSDVHLGSGIEGSVTGHIGGVGHVTLDAASRTNYRYGDNAANGEITQYAQYPFTVTSAHFAGRPIDTRSEESVAAHFGGKTLEAAERDEKVSKAVVKSGDKQRIKQLSQEVSDARDLHLLVKSTNEQHDLHSIATDPSHPKHQKLARTVDKNYEMMRAMYAGREHMVRRVPMGEAYPAPDLPRMVAGEPIAGHAALKQSAVVRRSVERHGYTVWPSLEDLKAKHAELKGELDKAKSMKESLLDRISRVLDE